MVTLNKTPEDEEKGDLVPATQLQIRSNSAIFSNDFRQLFLFDPASFNVHDELRRIGPGDVRDACTVDTTELQKNLFDPEHLNPTLAAVQNAARQEALRVSLSRNLEATNKLTPQEKENYDFLKLTDPDGARLFALKNKLAKLRVLTFGNEPGKDRQKLWVKQRTSAQLTQLFFEFRTQASDVSDRDVALAWDDMVLLYDLATDGKQQGFRDNPYVREYLLFALQRSHVPNRKERILQLVKETANTPLSGLTQAALGDALKNDNPDQAEEAYRIGFDSHFNSYPGLNLLHMQVERGIPSDQTDEIARSVGLALRLEGGADSTEYWTHAGMLEIACLQSNEEEFEAILKKIRETALKKNGDWMISITQERLDKAWRNISEEDPRRSRIERAVNELEKIKDEVSAAKGSIDPPPNHKGELESEEDSFQGKSFSFRSLLHSIPMQVHYKNMESVPDYTITPKDRLLLEEILEIWDLKNIENNNTFIGHASEKICALLGSNVHERGGEASKERIKTLRYRVAMLCGVNLGKTNVEPGKTPGTLTSASAPILLELGGEAAHAQLLQALYDLWQRRRVEALLQRKGKESNPNRRGELINEAEQLLSEELRTAVVDLYKLVHSDDEAFKTLENAGHEPNGTVLKIQYKSKGEIGFGVATQLTQRTHNTITIKLQSGETLHLDMDNGDEIGVCVKERHMTNFLVQHYFGREQITLAGSYSHGGTQGFDLSQGKLSLTNCGEHLVGQANGTNGDRQILVFQDSPADFSFRNDSGGELRLGGLSLSSPDQPLRDHLATREQRLTKSKIQYDRQHEITLRNAKARVEEAIEEQSKAIRDGTDADQRRANQALNQAKTDLRELEAQQFSPILDALTPLQEKLLSSDITDERSQLRASVRGGLGLMCARNLFHSDLENVGAVAREIADELKKVVLANDEEAIFTINALRQQNRKEPLDPKKAVKLIGKLRATFQGIKEGNIGPPETKTYLPLAIRDLDEILPMIDMEVKLALSRELHSHAMERENRKRSKKNQPPLETFEEYFKWLMGQEHTIGDVPPTPILQSGGEQRVALTEEKEGARTRLADVAKAFSNCAKEGQANPKKLTVDAVGDILDKTQLDDVDRTGILTLARTLEKLTTLGEGDTLPAADRWKILELSTHFLQAYRLSSFTKEITLQDLVALLHENALKLAHQNVADYETLVGSNHGVLHLLRSNGEMLLSVFNKLEHFNPERQALALQALFDHDMGYTKFTLQRGTPQDYLFQNSKDHPLESALLVEARRKHYVRYFGEGEFRSIRNSVLDHSDALGRGQYIDGRLKPQILMDPSASIEQHVIAALSLVDCVGTTGDVKLSSALREFPQILGFMAQVQEIWDEFREENPNADRLPDDLRNVAQSILQEALNLVNDAIQKKMIATATATKITRAIKYAMDLSESDFAIGLNFQMLGAHISTELDFYQNVPEVSYFVDMDGQKAIRDNLAQKGIKSPQKRSEKLVRIGMKAIKKAADDFGGFTNETSIAVATFIRMVNDYADDNQGLQKEAQEYFGKSEFGEGFRRDGTKLEALTQGGLMIVIKIGSKPENRILNQIITHTNTVTKARRETLKRIKKMINNEAIVLRSGDAVKNTTGLGLTREEAYTYICESLGNDAQQAFDVEKGTLSERILEILGPRTAQWPRENNLTEKKRVLELLVEQLEEARLRPIKGTTTTMHKPSTPSKSGPESTTDALPYDRKTVMAKIRLAITRRAVKLRPTKTQPTVSVMNEDTKIEGLRIIAGTPDRSLFLAYKQRTLMTFLTGVDITAQGASLPELDNDD